MLINKVREDVRTMGCKRIWNAGGELADEKAAHCVFQDTIDEGKRQLREFRKGE